MVEIVTSSASYRHKHVSDVTSWRVPNLFWEWCGGLPLLFPYVPRLCVTSFNMARAEPVLGVVWGSASIVPVCPSTLCDVPGACQTGFWKWCEGSVSSDVGVFYGLKEHAISCSRVVITKWAVLLWVCRRLYRFKGRCYLMFTSCYY